MNADPWPHHILETEGGAADRRARSHALATQFIEGQNLTFGSNRQDVDVKALKPCVRVPDWRVFALRPSHGLRLTRLMGEFAAPDVFVALSLVPRKLIGNWDKEAGHVDAGWLKLFEGHQPLHWKNCPSKELVGSNYSYV